jgi:hypothetical protein
MGLGCGDETRQKHPRWCSLFDGIIGATWAAAPDNAGVLAVGTAALDPVVPASGIAAYVYLCNQKLIARGEDGIDTVWAQQHPMDALKKLKQMGF